MEGTHLAGGMDADDTPTGIRVVAGNGVGVIVPNTTGTVCYSGEGIRSYTIGGEASKDTNPKDAVGIAKVPISTVPTQVIGEVGLAMLEGARKYGRHNYRVAGVRASVYYDAVWRHVAAWWEGQDIDPASGLSHITKAIAGLVVLRDAMMNEMWTDDRPPAVLNPGWVDEQSAKAAEIIARYPDAKAPFTQV